MLALQLFVMFFKIGLFSFGGGYAMVAIIEKELTTAGLMTSATYANVVAISQVTPGPLAVNVATYVGAILGENPAMGMFYAAVATFAVSLPAFIIIYIIARFFVTFGSNQKVKNVMGGIRPSVIGLILGSAVLFARLSIIDFTKLAALDITAINPKALLIAVAAFLVNYKTKISPMWILLGAGVVGLIIL